MKRKEISMNPDRVTKMPNGMYKWSCSIDADYYRKSMGAGFNACVIIAVFVLVFGAIIAFQYRDVGSFLIVLGSDAVFMLITIVVFKLAFSAKDPRENYEMCDLYVKSGYGKSSVYFDFDKAGTAVFARNYIELKGRIAKIRVYAPAEDFGFVRGYIMSHLSGECEIRYE